MKTVIPLLICFTYFGNIHGQCDDLQVIPIKEYLVAGMYSYFKIIRCEDSPLSENEVEAFQYKYRLDSLTNAYVRLREEVQVKRLEEDFQIRAKHPGFINIIFNNGEECIKTLRVKPLPVAAYLSKYTSKSQEKMSVGEFKAQPGLMARIVNFDIDARCNVEEFEIVRIPLSESPMRHLNQQGRFDDQSRAIIEETKGGDLYLFRNILARCPGDENARQLEDISLEIAESIYQIDSTFYPNGYKIRNQIDAGNGDTIRLDHFTGKYEIVSSQGIKKSQGSYNAKFGCEPEKNGTWIERYSNGTIKTIGSFLCSHKINTWTYFNNSGNIKKVENYAVPYSKLKKHQLPLLEGPYTEFYDNGEKKVEGEYIILEKYFTTDTSYVIDYDTYEESIEIIEGEFWRPVSLKHRRWIHYDRNGKLVEIEMERPDIGIHLRFIE